MGIYSPNWLLTLVIDEDTDYSDIGIHLVLSDSINEAFNAKMTYGDKKGIVVEIETSNTAKHKCPRVKVKPVGKRAEIDIQIPRNRKDPIEVDKNGLNQWKDNKIFSDDQRELALAFINHERDFLINQCDAVDNGEFIDSKELQDKANSFMSKVKIVKGKIKRLPD